MTDGVSSPHTTFGNIAAWWGVGGTVALLVVVIVRLFPYAAELLSTEVGLLHWGLLIANVLFMAYSEGYRGFQKSFSPRVAERAVALRSDPKPVRSLLAPLYVMGFFSAPRHVLATIYGITFGVCVLVQLVRILEQPWRGIVDAGVVVGLGWGAAVTLQLGARALRENSNH